MTLVAPPKHYKSILAMNLAMAVGGGLKWLNKFQCTRGRVLVIDSEHLVETLECRGTAACRALGYSPEEASKQIDYQLMRGKAITTKTIRSIFNSLKSDEYSLCIVDMFQNPEAESWPEAMRFISERLEELHCAAVLVYPAGVEHPILPLARLADTSVIVNQHERPCVFTVSVAARSFKSPDEFLVRAEYPLMIAE